ncbi:MAG: 30S ribosomal protein S10 [bacterium]
MATAQKTTTTEEKINIKNTEEESGQRIRIKIRAYDHKIIDQSAKTIIEAVERSGCAVRGPVPLPTQKNIFTVNKSTFVHKDARDQYEMRVHKRLLDIINPNAKTIDSLQNLNLPAGVDIEIKM